MPQHGFSLETGSILDDRYQILAQLGGGGFGRTYLAQDLQCREKCVLKEFAPQVESSQLKKAEELLKREAGILKELRHEQIPRSRQLLRLRLQSKDALFLVQEYIEGQSYWQQLRQGKLFNETEVTQLLLDLLPVLEYIHALDVIHRDISPDNLIQRQSDRKPVLIDFGCVKIAANAVTGAKTVTLVGKQGYAPEEQMLHGQAFPHSDLYALAVTVLVLLTGKHPHELYDRDWQAWQWREVEISSGLAKVLERMLASQPSDRYQSAQQVRQILERQEFPLASRLLSGFRTLVVAPGDRLSAPTQGHQPEPSALKWPQFSLPKPRLPRLDLSRYQPQVLEALKRTFVRSSIVILPALVAFAGVRVLNSSFHRPAPNQTEETLQQQLSQRLRALNINQGAFYQRVDDQFYAQYPELAGVKLTNTADHQQFREAWYEIAHKLMQQQERERRAP
ncbi:MAG: protein kinase [Cyanophyceae cyanobacterium]